MIIHWTWGYTQISDKATFGDPGWGFHHERGWPVFSIWESQGDLKHHGFLPGERVKTKLSEATQLGWETQAECCTSKRRCASLEGKADMDRWRAGLPCAWFVFFGALGPMVVLRIMDACWTPSQGTLMPAISSLYQWVPGLSPEGEGASSDPKGRKISSSSFNHCSHHFCQ